MRIDVLTIFPEMFPPVLGVSMLQRAQAQRLVEIGIHNLRDYTHDKHRTVDDRPYGGGPGMIMKPEPIFEAVEDIKRKTCRSHAEVPAARCETILMSPAGETLTSARAQQLASVAHALLICGHYEGVDERVKTLITRSLSIGDYVLTGGELPAMVVIDAIARFIPGVIGHDQATEEESFMTGLLEYPQYTRPPVFRGLKVPDVLLSGDHERIAKWRAQQSVEGTALSRPDLMHGNGHPQTPTSQQSEGQNAVA